MKRVIFYVLMLPMVLGMMISCSEAKTDAKKLEGKWNVIEVKGEKILKEGLPYMEFDMAQNKLHGNAGCNMFNSSFTLDDKDISSITIAPGAATMMACPDMATEDAIMQAMGNVKAVKAGSSENEMVLVDQDGNVLLVLSKN
ncbi:MULTISPECIES: META domain-containing protein [Parabacteroides]|jgi:heat shock protein HslJ|uniref:META domain-containing protein n=1 Tax=Parabacteroides TaxID=375288 RepID=UPI000F00D5E0|nr:MULTISPECIES: META domain-containing protein [Parabacteroides]RHU24255.1 META domain-containing protein [Parabacteroides sp. TM07-1AC]WFE86888.1 META domain-containing protein [Parabacteroides chongii]